MNYVGSNAQCVPVNTEPETLKSLQHLTNERLRDAVSAADAILNAFRMPMPHNENEEPIVNTAMDAERFNASLAEHLCDTLKEITLQIGHKENYSK